MERHNVRGIAITLKGYSRPECKIRDSCRHVAVRPEHCQYF